MAKKTGKANLGPEMAKKAYEAKVSGLKPFDPNWDDKPARQRQILDGTKVTTKPGKGKTRIGKLSGGGGGMFGIKNR
jgi:hypothetical protein